MPAGSNIFKVQYQYAGGGGDSWSEVYYATATNPSDLLPVSTGFYTGRRAILDPTCSIQRVRVSNVTGLRNTAVRVLNWPGTATTGGGPSAPGAAAVFNLVGATGGSRKLWLRGIPNGLIVQNVISGMPLPPGGLTANFNYMMIGLQSYGFGIRQLQFAQKFFISSVNASTQPGQAVVTYVVPPNVSPPSVAANSRLIIATADKKTLPGINGQWTVLTTGTNSFTIRYQVALNGNILQNCGYFKMVNYSGVSIFDPKLSSFAYYGTHTTRSSFTNSRGARRAQRIRTLA